MKKFVKQMAAVFAIALCAAQAHAVTYYVSDCQSGAAKGCKAGNDSNAGTSQSAPWKTTAKVRAIFSSMGAGDRILFAQGGAWKNASMVLRNLNSSIANPITFDSYPPSWYTGGAKPILRETRKNLAIFDFSGNPSIPNEGYVIRNFSLVGAPGTGDSASAFSVLAGAGGVTIDNVTTREFEMGLYCGDEFKNVTLRNSSITHSRFTGVMSGCSNLLVENNVFDHNGYDPAPIYVKQHLENRNHSIYFSSPTDPAKTTRNTTIRGNVFTNTTQFSGVCKGVVIVAHSYLDGVLIENNVIDESPNNGPNKGGCWGIAISPAYFKTPEDIRNVTIRGNRIVDVGGIGIEVGGCSNCVIENNAIFKNDGQAQVAIQAPGQHAAPEDAPMGALTIRNNSIYFGKTAEWAIGIQVSEGSNHILSNNLIYFAAGNPNHYCFSGDASFPMLNVSKFIKYDNNLCYHAGNNGHYSWNRDTPPAGIDANLISTNPAIFPAPAADNLYAMRLASGSPAVSMADAASSPARDITGNLRDSQPDIGAFEKDVPGLAVCTLTATPSTVALGRSSKLKVSCSPFATSYAWTNINFPSQVADGTVTPAKTTTYSVVGRNSAGDSVSASVTVQVTP